MKVYVLTMRPQYEQTRVVGVFASREDAENPLYDDVLKEYEQDPPGFTEEGTNQRALALLDAVATRDFEVAENLWFDEVADRYDILEHDVVPHTIFVEDSMLALLRDSPEGP